MTFNELNRDQLIELKQHMLCQRGDPSWGELADADSLISDEEAFAEYGDVEFVPEDFACSVCA